MKAAKLMTLTSVPSPSPKPPATPPIQINNNKKWFPLNLTQEEISLPLTFPTGQTFLWKQTSSHQFTGPIGPHLISLSHHSNSLSFHLHNHSSSSSSSISTAKLAVLDFLNSELTVPNCNGVRVLRQNPLQCLFQFLCSSNNNIPRITQMVSFLSSLGPSLGSVSGFDFHQFPSLCSLTDLSEQDLRAAGFGYRAKYVVGTVSALMSKPGGGEHWLLSLRKMELSKVIRELTSLPGVGPKVAACVALFSLDQHHAVPVDTHVWQIATRDLLPELAGVRMTPKLCERVAEAFVDKYGEYAGWVQTRLFVADLPAQKRVLTPDLKEKKKRSVKRKIVEAGIDLESVDDDL